MILFEFVCTELVCFLFDFENMKLLEIRLIVWWWWSENGDEAGVS